MSRAAAEAKDECWIVGPYYPVGDIEWVCRTHGNVVCEMWNPLLPVSRSNMRCPVANPKIDDQPLEYESRS